MAKQSIKFRFTNKPIGFSIEGVNGNFYPVNTTMYREVQGMIGMFPFEGIDITHVHEVPIENEFPRDLPDYLNEAGDEAVKKEYIVRQAMDASNAHSNNNRIREALQYYVDQGNIVIVEDPFLDRTAVRRQAKTGKPTKAAVAAE